MKPKSASSIVKKTLALTLLLQLLTATQIILTKAAPITVTKVHPYHNFANVGETFTVNITITDVHNLFGLEVTLYWNSTILKVIRVDVQLGVESHANGVLHEPIFIKKNETLQEKGTYQLIATSTGGDTPAFYGSGNIVRITFNVTNQGSCKLNLETKLASKPTHGGVSSPIAHMTIDGYFGQTQQFNWQKTTFIIVVVITAAATAGTTFMMFRKRTEKSAT